MVRCVACLKNEANPKNFNRFHHFYCDECVATAAKEAAQEGNKEKEAEQRGRTQGVVFAAAWMAKWHHQTTMAEEMLRTWGTDLKDAQKNKCDAGDINSLKEEKVW